MQLVKKINLSDKRSGFDSPVTEKSEKKYDPETLDQQLEAAQEAKQRLDEQQELEAKAASLDALCKERNRVLSLDQAKIKRERVENDVCQRLAELVNERIPAWRTKYSKLQAEVDLLCDELDDIQSTIFGSYRTLSDAIRSEFYIEAGGEKTYDPTLPNIVQPQPDTISRWVEIAGGDVTKLQTIQIYSDKSSLADVARYRCRAGVFVNTEQFRQLIVF